MARTGERYQQALERILAARGASAVDLMRVEYFGVPVVLATFEVAGRLACVIVSRRDVFPRTPLFGLGGLTQ